MYVRLTTGALLVLDAKSHQRPIGILVPLDEHWGPRVDILKALRAQLLYRKRSPPPLTSQQRRRIQLALRTLDARRDRASYQTIAGHLFGAEAVSREHWKTSSLKAQFTRLSAHGTHLTTKGYRFLLLGKGPTGRSKPRK
jgi:ribosomal protein S7